MNRRRLLRFAAAAAAAPLLRPLLCSPAHARAEQDLRFRVLREGSSVGEHSVRFKPDGHLLIVTTRVEIEVKVLLFTAYQFRHEAQEIWDSGRLLWVQSTTNDNGRRMQVQGEATPAGFRIVGERGPFLAPPELLTSNSFWDSRIVHEKRLIDVRHGGDVGLVTRPLGDELVTTPQGSVKASRYQMITPYNAGSVFHDANGRWVKALLEVKGESIEYVLSS